MSMALTDKVKSQWAMVSSHWEGLPAILRGVLDELGARVRRALALPSKEELTTLSARLDLLDARIRELAEKRATVATAVVEGVTTARKVRAAVSPSKRTRKP